MSRGESYVGSPDTNPVHICPSCHGDGKYRDRQGRSRGACRRCKGAGTMLVRYCVSCGAALASVDPRAKWCSEPCRNDVKREWDRKHDRARCVECGVLLYSGSLHNGTKRCRDHEAERIAEKAAVRYREIQRLWREGLSVRAIGERLGMTTNNAGVTMVRMRQLGWDLPYRYAVENGKRVAA